MPDAGRLGPKWKTVRTDATTGIKQAIRDELEAAGMTQADLADYLGSSQKHVSQVLTGNVTGTFGFLARMAAACGLTITAVRKETSGV